MQENEIMNEEEFVEEIPEEDAAITSEVGSAQVTLDDMPELSGLNIGDTISITIQDISEDGNVFTLAMAEEIAEELPPAGMGAEAIGGAL